MGRVHSNVAWRHAFAGRGEFLPGKEDRRIKLLNGLHKDESGQDLIEYALIAALIAVGSVVTMQSLATTISSEFAHIGTYLT